LRKLPQRQNRCQSVRISSWSPYKVRCCRVTSECGCRSASKFCLRAVRAYGDDRVQTI
jgi:hypothetical protein